MTIQQIYEETRGTDQNFRIFCVIAEASKEHEVHEIREYLISKGYTKEYIEEMIQTMRAKSIIPPWD